MFVFQKFNKLTALNLVFMQNELASLERELERLETSMVRDDDAISSQVNWARIQQWAGIARNRGMGNAPSKRQDSRKA